MKDNRILHAIEAFSEEHGQVLTVGATRWRYYALGQGPAMFWLTGGLRRAAFGFVFLKQLARTHRVITPDYPPVMTFGEMAKGLDALLRTEGVERAHLGGQSYGGLVAQAYLALHPDRIDRLVLSSSGPADYGRPWMLADYVGMALAQILPGSLLKRALGSGLGKILSVPEAERAAWQAALEHILATELARQDVISHFAVAADVIRMRIVRPRSFDPWQGGVIVLTASNDPTQSPSDIPRYETLFRRQVDVIDMGSLGPTAAWVDPDSYVEMLQRALS